MRAPPWWKTAVVYHIYPRSFADSDGDGVGDLRGITARLDYLAWLGVDALWLSPIYRSPMADFGYDIADHTDVDPLFGTLDDADRLIAAAHERGLRVLLDWVPNHTSDRHPWFVESRSSRDSPKRDWYIWRDPAADGGPPNNWVATFGQRSAWTFDEASRQYYLHLFLPEQPDLNWRNPEVAEAMHAVLRFWLDRGVDGFRADVVHLIGKNETLPDDPSELVGVPRVGFHDDSSTHALLRGIRRILDGYPGDRVMVGEINLLDSARIAAYYGQDDELHLAFNFRPLFAAWDATTWRTEIATIAEHYGAAGAWPTWVLSNHDQPRHATRFGSEDRARAAAVLLLTLRGTPFLYGGEELGLQDADVPDERRVDPGGRDGCRAPIPWDDSPTHGWATAHPWLPWPPDADRRNALTLRGDAASILHLYRRLLAARRASPALHAGDLRLLESVEGVVGFDRAAGDDARRVFVNFTSEPRDAAADDRWTVELSSTGARERQPFAGRLRADEAVVLRPSS